MEPTTIIVAGISAAGVMGGAAVTGLMRNRNLKMRLDQARQEMRFQRDALDVTAFINDWDGLMSELHSLMADTNIDRFLILRAWNGYLEPKWTSAVYQLHGSGHPVMSYIHVELDDDYISRLRRITTAGPVVFKTSDLKDDALIRGIYDGEGVVEAMWAHIETLSVPGSNAKAVTYCSFGTKAPGGMGAVESTRASLVLGRLKGFASGFSIGTEAGE